MKIDYKKQKNVVDFLQDEKENQIENDRAKKSIIDKLYKKLKQSNYIIFKGTTIPSEYVHVTGNIWSYTKIVGFDTEKTMYIDIEADQNEIFFVQETYNRVFN